ncbi:hypothetical protein [Phytoactinopolyspora halotolerans]|uniref:Uncharacterized protein n=1 Tax=Phytoactinopolyspora halotolerans TaxID=1981512 RepID=A0A6L9SGF0_9ACTN|nr:hypothetical protein [Phytoactinopolyspora halotolerans]NEE03724.1 hypothetical protein [Phytoactinopolyspora halotolerans]
MDALDLILGLLFIVLLTSGGWIVWGVVQSRQRAHELKVLREREATERARLQIEADERAQERADRIYLDAVHRHTDPEPRELKRAAPEDRDDG